MNTEFPRRLPTVRNSGDSVSTTVSKSSTHEEDNSIQKQILGVVKNAFTTLNRLADKVYNFVDRHRQDRNKERKEKDLNTKNQEKAVDGNNKRGNSKRNGDDDAAPNIGKRILDSINRGFNKYKEGISKLQYTVENVNSSIGDAISGVFGSGLFGRALGSIITKALNFVVSKVLIGVIFGNPLLLIIAASLGTVIWLCTKYWTEIVDALKSVWNSIKDLYNWIAGFFGKDKTDEAKEYAGEEFAVPERVLDEYYGTDKAGKKKMLEEMERAKTDPEFNEELKKKLYAAEDDMKSRDERLYENIDRLAKGYAALPWDPKTEVNQTYINNNYGIDPMGFGGTIDDLMATGYMPYSPIVNTVNNNSNVEMSTFDNVSEAYPTSVVSPVPFPSPRPGTTQW